MSLVNAALRPSGKSYRDRLIRKEFNTNPSKEIDELLKDNYGYLVFQEDTIKFLTDICGFDGAAADSTRRAIGKKLKEELKQQLPKILKGYCNKSSQPEDVAIEEAEQFLQIIDDSSEYQFGYNHSTGYSMNGYGETRLRTYHPLEFVTAYLNRAEDEKDIINGITLAKQLNIQIKPITYGKSLAQYTFDRTENAIYKGMESIKYLSSNVSDELFTLSQETKHTDFFELLHDIHSKTSTDARQLKILIGLNFFRAFGKNKRLIQMVELYDNFASRKQIGFKDIEKLNINESILKKYSKKVTEKMYKELDMMGYVREMAKTIEDKPFSIKQQVEFEIINLGYTTYRNENAGKDFYIIVEYKTYTDKTKPYVTLKNVKTGEEMKTKVKNGKDFTENPFKLFDVLKVLDFKTQYKMKNIGGKWERSKTETEEILSLWEVY